MITPVSGSGRRADTLDPASGTPESRTYPAESKAKNGGLALLLLLTCSATVAAQAGDDRWPPFLGPTTAYPDDIVVTVERLWLAPTLTRTVRATPVRVPFELYATLVDEPEVTAAAARHLGLARYEVTAIDDDWYRATDNDGARGVWRILAREPTRWVVLSRGEHSGRLLGRIGGSALTVIELEPGGEGVQPTLTAHVHIDNRVAAALARVLVTIFGHLADRKLSEGFRVTAAVAEWATGRPEEFCAWLNQQPIPAPRRARLLDVMSECGLAHDTITRPRHSAGPATPPLPAPETGTANPAPSR